MMSGIYIPMEMPTAGTVIAIYRLKGKFYASMHRGELCPIIPVPDHGDLIDRDEAARDLRMDYAYAAARIVSLQPTIIPGDTEDEKANILIGTDMNGGIKRDENGNVIDWGITGPPGDPGWVIHTNGDRFRAMSDEELAKWYGTHACCMKDPFFCKEKKACRDCWLTFLKSPVDKEGE